MQCHYGLAMDRERTCEAASLIAGTMGVQTLFSVIFFMPILSSEYPCSCAVPLVIIQQSSLEPKRLHYRLISRA